MYIFNHSRLIYDETGMIDVVYGAGHLYIWPSQCLYWNHLWAERRLAEYCDEFMGVV